MHVHLEYQRPGIGEYEHDHKWALVAPSGEALTYHYTPEAALLEAIDRAGHAPLRLRRRGEWRFDLEPA